MNIDVQVQLERNQKLEDKIDIAVSCAIFLPLLGTFAWALWDAFSSQHGLPVVAARGVLILLAGLQAIRVAKWVLPRLTAHFAPSFIIDTSATNVVKLYGSIRLDGADKAEEKLLSARPDLQLYRGDAYKDFGCTLAAVPATADFLQARSDLQKLGVLIR
ncbi:hypothetical protein N7388_23180 [Stutzerimonas stutzeri]|uniref:hypothetical protein n=1 Tax=Stutzerimonas stutzeri TaxID=316 RepID=UPI001BD60433|nr:hypothetical protein [Stutzerimonas stutzeri]MBS9726668.1 hypothetical protein [Stutzerimonas stutzeri]MCC8345213.1 hypothetical protein [Stutzerimonas stutzeri]MDH0446566.1 hypothetical protein [Stutzerimonas stutzeri]